MVSNRHIVWNRSRGSHVKIYIKRFHIDLSVGRQGDTVDAEQSLLQLVGIIILLNEKLRFDSRPYIRKRMHNIRNLLHPGDGAGDIRRMGTSHQLRLVGQQRLQLVKITHGVGCVSSRPPFHRQSEPLRCANPCRRVGFVVQLRQDQLVARLEVQRGGEVVEELRGGCAEYDLHIISRNLPYW